MEPKLKNIKTQMMFIRSIKVQVSISVFNLRPALFFPFYVLRAQLGKNTCTMFYFHHTLCNQLWEELWKAGGGQWRGKDLCFNE